LRNDAASLLYRCPARAGSDVRNWRRFFHPTSVLPRPRWADVRGFTPHDFGAATKEFSPRVIGATGVLFPRRLALSTVEIGDARPWPRLAGTFRKGRKHTSSGSELNCEGDARGQRQWLSAAGKDVAQRRPTEGLLKNFSLRCRLRFRHRR
jgi:hypothetical protein